jgi:hypothetical protein
METLMQDVKTGEVLHVSKNVQEYLLQMDYYGEKRTVNFDGKQLEDVTVEAVADDNDNLQITSLSSKQGDFEAVDLMYLIPPAVQAKW